MNKWQECGLEEIRKFEIPQVGTPYFGKVAPSVDAFGEPLRKNGAAVAATMPSVNARVRHLRSGKTGTVTYVASIGQCIAVGFDDGTVAMCEPKDLSVE